MVSPASQAHRDDGQKAPRRARGWIWFFVILGILTVLAIAVEGWFTSQRELTPERFVEARKKWNEKGPADYHLEYTLSSIGGTDKYETDVRAGKVGWSLRNGQMEEERRFHYADMRALFRFIEDYLEQDNEPGKPRTYVTATFDANDGHVLHYTRNVLSKRERQEIRVMQFRPTTERQEKTDKSAP